MRTANSEHNAQNPNWNRQNEEKKIHGALPKNHFLHFAHTNTLAQTCMHINARMNRLRLKMMDCKLTTRLMRHDAIHFGPFCLQKKKNKTFQPSERLFDKLMWLRPKSHFKLI